MKRNKTIDIAKGIGILLVILGHCAIPVKLYTLIYLFHMPLFFFTAGLVFRPTTDSEALFQKKKRTLLIPYAVYGMLFIIVDTALNAPCFDRLITNLLALTLQIDYSTEWFLIAMFVTVILANVLLNKSSKVLNIVAAVLFILSSFLFHIPEIKLPFALTKVPVALFYFAIGYNSKQIVNTLTVKRAAIFITWGTVMVFTEILSGYKVIQHMFCNIYRPYFVVPLFSVPLIFSVIGVSYLINQKGGRFLSFLGKNSLTVFGIHQPLCIYIIEYFIKPENNLAFALIEFVFALSVSLLFVFLFRKFEKRCRIFHYL